MRFFVFSYNRGEFLENCITSIERCAADCGITIFDDHSEDEVTRQVLQSLSGRHQVMYPPLAAGPGGKHGGLYRNMQSALDTLDPATVFCFLQDDMQLVRKVSGSDYDAIVSYFETFDDAGFMQPAFLKASTRDSDQALTRFDARAGGYLIDRLASSAGAFYSDVLVARKSNLQTSNWTFLNGEAGNERQARRKVRQLVYLRNPFAAWLPGAPAYRGKTLTLALRLGYRLSHCGFHPVRYMSDEATAKFLERDPAILPYAEDFLSLAGPALPTPWIYHPLQGRRMLKLLNSAELSLRRLGK